LFVDLYIEKLVPQKGHSRQSPQTPTKQVIRKYSDKR